MSLWRSISSALVCGLVAVACAGAGDHAPYAACTPGDACSSSTVCETATEDSSAVGIAFCTHSCMFDDDCPSDETGTKGVCTDAFDGDESSVAFCYRSCESSPCPAGSTCVQTLDPLDEHVMACQPTAPDPLGGSTWVSDTISPIAKSDGVTQSTYTMTFGASTTVSGGATGDFGATLVQVFAASSNVYPGCTETTTFSRATFAELASSSAGGVVEIVGGSATSDRTGCQSPSDDVTGEGASMYIEQVESQSATPFTIAGGTMTIQGGTGVVPFGDAVPWTFTQP